MQSNEQAMQKAMRMAKSGQGQQLLKMLQQNHGDTLSQAMHQAAKGDYAQAQQLLTKIFTDPEAQKLLKQFGG